MKLISTVVILSLGAMHASVASAVSDKGVENSDVVPLTRFLESEPFSKDAPLVRAQLLKWEDTSKDVVDVVCPSLLAPIPSKSIPYSGELVAQFIFGSAASQIADPSTKGKLLATQVAGMRSMLKAYRSIRVQKPDVRVPRLDEFAQHEADGTLDKFMGPLVAAAC